MATTAKINVEVEATLVFRYEQGEREVKPEDLSKMGYVHVDVIERFIEEFMAKLVLGSANLRLHDAHHETMAAALTYALQFVGRGLSGADAVDTLDEWDRGASIVGPSMNERLRTILHSDFKEDQ